MRFIFYVDDSVTYKHNCWSLPVLFKWQNLTAYHTKNFVPSLEIGLLEEIMKVLNKYVNVLNWKKKVVHWLVFILAVLRRFSYAKGIQINFVCLVGCIHAWHNIGKSIFSPSWISHVIASTAWNAAPKWPTLDTVTEAENAQKSRYIFLVPVLGSWEIWTARRTPLWLKARAGKMQIYDR